MSPKRKASSSGREDESSRKKRGKKAATGQSNDLVETPEEHTPGGPLQDGEHQATETGAREGEVQTGEELPSKSSALHARQDAPTATRQPTARNETETGDYDRETERDAPASLLAQLKEQRASIELLDYVEWVMQPYNFPETELAWREGKLNKLIKKHGDGSNWRVAPPFALYISGELEVEDEWPLQEGDFLYEWERLEQALWDNMMSEDALLEFIRLRERTQRQKLFFIPPGMPQQQPADEYVRETLRNDYFERAISFLRPVWDDEFEAGDNPMMDEDAKRAYASIFINNEDHDLPYSVDEYLWRRKWNEARAALQARGTDKNAQGRFDDAWHLAHEEFDQYGNFIQPIELTDALQSPRYLANLRKHVRNEIHANFHKTWEKVIAEARTLDEYRKWLGYYDEMRLDTRRQTWRPTGLPSRPDTVPTASWHAQHLSPGKDRSTIGGVWNFEQILGAGGRGHASLWLKFDSAARIVDRIVAKDSYLGKWWDDPKAWYQDVSLRMPKEWKVNQLLRACKDSDHIVHTESTFSIYELAKIHRLYFELCTHGTLEGVIATYKELSQRRRIDQHGENLSSFSIPARALWAILEALTSAACLMRYGSLPDNGEPELVPGHQPVIHIDIKPDNVFLTTPDQTFWPEVPVVKLADFGLARFENDEGVEWGDGEGTFGYEAPEQQEYASTSEWYHKLRMSSKSDVWAIGRTILSLMNLLQSRNDRDEEIPVLNLDSSGDVPVDFETAEGSYPEDLCKLVKACLQKLPDNRISVAELWTQIRLKVASFEGLRGLPLKMRKGEDDELLYYQPDKYALWSRAM